MTDFNTQQANNLSEHVSKKEAEMAEVLAKIVRDKYQWVAERKASQHLSTFQSDLLPSDRSFYDALSGDKTVFITECKKHRHQKALSATTSIWTTSRRFTTTTQTRSRF